MAHRKILGAAILLAAVAGTLFAARPEAAYWPEWRGPDRNGMAPGAAPTRWSDTENVKWKAAIPGRGHSSPVIWGDRIFLTTAVPTGPAPQAAAAPEPAGPQGEGRGARRGPGGPGGDSGPQAEHRFDVLCLDRKTGKLLWQKTAKVAAPHEGYHRTYGSFASNSPVTDGKRVWAFFGSRGVYCYDVDGKLVWEKDLGVQMRMKLGFGEGMAPVLEKGRLILTFDQEADSFIVALDAATGKEIWRASRDETTNWAMPLAVEHGGRTQIVVSATKKVRSYDFETGKLLWECAGLGANTIPAPVHQSGIVYVMSGFRNPNLLAIRLGREGDLTGTDAIVWTQTRGLSYTASPVLYDNRLYAVTDNGMLSCFDAATGTPYYHQVRLPKTYSFKSSPVGAAGKLYLATENDDVVVVKMGETFEVLSTNTLAGQVFIATPAVAAGELFLRGQNQLFCISEAR